MGDANRVIDSTERAAVLLTPTVTIAPEPNIVSGNVMSDVACLLLMQFGSHVFSTGGRSVTVTLPSTSGGVKLLGDVVVRAGDTLRLESALQASLLSVGRSQIRVESKGTLELVRVHVIDSVETSAVFSEGSLHLVNCTFERCVASMNVINRVAEGMVILDTDSGSSRGLAVVPATLGAWGGAVLAVWSTASVISSGTIFQNNGVRDGYAVNAGGAIATFGAAVTLEAGTTFTGNYAQRAIFMTRGGAISAVYSQLNISNAAFLRNWAQQDDGQHGDEPQEKPVDSESGKVALNVTGRRRDTPTVDPQWSPECYPPGSAFSSNLPQCNCLGLQQHGASATLLSPSARMCRDCVQPPAFKLVRSDVWKPTDHQNCRR
jgi:hypothetical protein